MLIEEAEPTHRYCCQTLEIIRKSTREESSKRTDSSEGEIDAFVQKEIAATCGHFYTPLIGRLTRYPIPDDLPLNSGKGWFLDVGSNWGRWAIAAARLGYKSVGLDPSLEAIMALRRVSCQLGYPVIPVVGDSRFLPFHDNVFDVVFSYSVLQHFDKEVARKSIAEMSRVCKHGGTVLVQMPNKFGLRQTINRFKQWCTRDSNPFRVRYWSPRELMETFHSAIGPTELSVDGFFSLNPRLSDIDLLPRRYAALVLMSAFLRSCSKRLPWLLMLADSLWVKSTKV